MEGKELSQLVGLMAEMLHEQRETNGKLGEMNKRLEKLEDQQVKTNLAIGELRISVLALPAK